LSTQVSQRTIPEIQVWVALLRAHASSTRRFNAQLSHADGKHLRRVDLAERILLTPSGITRLLEGLERGGYVERASCASDARVTYAQLTDDGEEKLREAADAHVAGIREFFRDRFSRDELVALSGLLQRLPLDPTEELSCTPE
jgi:DNA-binding MarR family transcriptional regulator